MKNVGTLTVTNETLAEALPLPEGTKILGCKQSNPQDGSVTLYVEGEGIPPRKEGEICPEVMLEVTRHETKLLTSKFITY